ncbi:MAG: sensor histidine kinase [Candidatus Delongbacteria bacterium]|nr:sensor histidine kinase [Candidatus Delongbacteria bacterium]MBN2834833.1 sensor histidine kinase [Candidatus Delongbacteria bacterium]
MKVLTKSPWNHITIWLLIISYVVYSASMVKNSSISSISHILFVALTPILLVTYSNILLMKKFFFKKKIKKYIIYILLVNVAVTIITNYYLMTNFKYDNPFLQDFVSVIFFTLISSSLLFFVEFYKQQASLSEIKNKQIETELKLLKTQINPHFMFNTLNNIYSLSLDKNDKLPDVILQLSELMRYLLYETENNYKTIDEELKFIQNYINLEKLRLNENVEVIEIYEIENYSFQIAPLIILPFIENIFKHGFQSGRKELLYGEITILCSIEKLFLKTRNTIPEHKRGNLNSGKGIENVKKRLKLLYYQNYKLEIDIRSNEFLVELEIGEFK